LPVAKSQANAHRAQRAVSGPPKTTDELMADAKKLTVFNADGSIQRAGFVPISTYYCCAANALDLSYMFNAQYLDANGRSAFASDPNWAKLFEWQHQFIADVYGNGDFQTGADKLAEFVSGAGGEWGNNQDFIKGRVAITIDGEWRNAFIKDADPNLAYDTAPLPTSPDSTDRYGGGPTGGTVLALPKGSPHPNEAWLLLKYLATDTPTLVYMANNVNNVPTTFDSLQSPDLDVTPQFQTFLDIFANENSHYKEPSAIGASDQNIVQAFADNWQTGKDTDLQAGLESAATQINNQLAQANL
jgi:multiple sugar transport system substrate-binding protein